MIGVVGAGGERSQRKAVPKRRLGTRALDSRRRKPPQGASLIDLIMGIHYEKIG